MFPACHLVELESESARPVDEGDDGRLDTFRRRVPDAVVPGLGCRCSAYSTSTLLQPSFSRAVPRSSRPRFQLGSVSSA